MVEQRKSIGIVLFTEAPERKYLLLHYAAGHWDFPKGGVEKREKEEETMRRELWEETGITQLERAPGFVKSFSYFFREDGKLIRKTVVFHLGKTDRTEVKLSFEHTGYEWLPYEQAREKLTYDNAKKLLAEAEEFLKRRT